MDRVQLCIAILLHSLLIALCPLTLSQVFERAKCWSQYFSRSGELRHIRHLQPWPLDRVLAEKYGMSSREVWRGVWGGVEEVWGKGGVEEARHSCMSSRGVEGRCGGRFGGKYGMGSREIWGELWQEVLRRVRAGKDKAVDS